MHSLKIHIFSCLKAEMKTAELERPEHNRAVHRPCPLQSALTATTEAEIGDKHPYI